MSGTNGVSSLRERKKQRTRYAIITAAIDLFLERGYDETTVAEIADAAEVAPRTFFRYFATKDEVALALIAESDENVVRALRERPAEEPPITALRHATRIAVEQLMDADDGTGALWARIVRLLETSPPLLAAHLQRVVAIDGRLARELARREEVDPDTDMRPLFAVGLVSAAVRTAHHKWSAVPGATVDDLLQLRDAALDLCEPLDHHWART